MIELKELSKDERSLLLYLETRAVDYGGRVDARHMNEADFEIAKRWNKENFVGFGRIVMRHHNVNGTHWCKLSDEAFALAHSERKARSERMWSNKTWLSTEDSMAINGSPHSSKLNSPLTEDSLDERNG